MEGAWQGCSAPLSIVRQAVAPGGSWALGMEADMEARVAKGGPRQGSYWARQYEGTKKLRRPHTRAPQEAELQGMNGSAGSQEG